jgi:hypothetical protein
MMDLGLQQALQAFMGCPTWGIYQAGEGRERNGQPVAVVTGSSSGVLADRLRSDGFTSVQGFALVPSATATRWIIPIENRHLALSGLRLCMPSAAVARFLKQVLVAGTAIGWTGWARHKLLVASRQPLTIESLVREVTGERHPVFALSLGTLGRFRKLAIQVMRPDGEILGYVKLPMSEEAIDRVQQEAAVLERLSGFATLRAQIPRVLHAGKWGDSYILFQSAGPLTAAPIEFGPVYQDFLKKLSSVEMVEKPGLAVVDAVGARWRKAEVKLDSPWRALGGAALVRANHQLERATVLCGITHGDFAPWNSRVSNGQLYVFDWELAQWQAPTGWDTFHFHVQVSNLLSRGRSRWFDLNHRKAERASFLLYLLNSTCICLEEETPDCHIALGYRQHLLAKELSEE